MFEISHLHDYPLKYKPCPSGGLLVSPFAPRACILKPSLQSPVRGAFLVLYLTPRTRTSIHTLPSLDLLINPFILSTDKVQTTISTSLQSFTENDFILFPQESNQQPIQVYCGERREKRGRRERERRESEGGRGLEGGKESEKHLLKNNKLYLP